MRKQDISARLEDIVGVLRSAIDFKGPYYMEINGVYTSVTREQLLEFQIDCAVESLWDLKEDIDGEIVVTGLPDGGCEVAHKGETIIYSKEEVEEMEKEFKVALVKALGKRGECT